MATVLIITANVEDNQIDTFLEEDKTVLDSVYSALKLQLKDEEDAKRIFEEVKAQGFYDDDELSINYYTGNSVFGTDMATFEFWSPDILNRYCETYIELP